ncbi:uncharacterized protein LOC141660613 [Apium graveolens]|uniref:uncharacterized protein LOC141660613 n=1 Tax=Apium graveolens TaxID=4045 RepID=UPI003D7C0033
MALKMQRHFAIFCLAMLMLGLFASPTEAKFKGINPFCRTSDYRRICNIMVGGATNWHDATRNGIQSALRAAMVLQKLTPQLDQALVGVDQASKADAVSTCKEIFDGAVDNMKQALVYFDTDDIGGLNSYLSAAIGIDDCQEAFKQAGAELPPAVTKISNNLSMQVGNCLAITQQT